MKRATLRGTKRLLTKFLKSIPFNTSFSNSWQGAHQSGPVKSASIGRPVAADRFLASSRNRLQRKPFGMVNLGGVTEVVFVSSSFASSFS